jgi:DNA-binding response OmpR family regulator
MIGNNALVLVVDDEVEDIDFVRHALEGAGFKVLTAATYEQALELFDANSEEVDLILADVSLPGRNGVELSKALLRKKSSLRVLFVSGHVGAEVIRFYGLPATDRHFLQKPFTAVDLISRVAEVLKSDEALSWLSLNGDRERERPKPNC